MKENIALATNKEIRKRKNLNDSLGKPHKSVPKNIQFNWYQKIKPDHENQCG